jgi:glutamyl-tRNA reductase
MIGAGETNTSMANYLQKHKFANFTVFNRTLANAEILAGKLNGKAHTLTDLKDYNQGFDVLICCTGATEALVTPAEYEVLKANEKGRKVIIDLALPGDVAKEVVEQNALTYVNINSLRDTAEKNMQSRKGELVKCQKIVEARLQEFKDLHKERKVELAFGEIPKQVKAIKELAMNEVFCKEINSLDLKSKEVLDKVLTYMEKKYNAVAMKTAKDVLLSKEE